MIALSAGLLGAMLLAVPPPTVDAQIQDGIARFRNLDDEGATAVLQAALSRKPAPEQEAQAHLYLGLIAFNALRADDAKEQFRLALAASPYVELPTDASPKSKLLFAQVREGLLHDSQAGGTSAAPVAPVVVSAEPLQGGESRAARWYAWVTAAGAAAALGLGVGFGVAQASAQASLKTTNDASQATGLGQSVARDGLIADVLFGVGGAAGVVAVVLFALPSHDGGEPAASVSLGPGALEASLRW